MDCFAEGVVYHDAIYLEPFFGKPALRNFFRQFSRSSTLQELNFEIVSMVADDTNCAVIWCALVPLPRNHMLPRLHVHRDADLLRSRPPPAMSMHADEDQDQERLRALPCLAGWESLQEPGGGQGILSIFAGLQLLLCR